MKSQSTPSPATLLDILPLEVIFTILDLLEPEEYSGFTCTCRRALELTNNKLEGEIPVAAVRHSPFFASLTGQYLVWQKWLALERLYQAEMEVSCHGYVPLEDEDDPDL